MLAANRLGKYDMKGGATPSIMNVAKSHLSEILFNFFLVLFISLLH